MAKLIILVGLPGAGKSTYADKLTAVARVTKYVSSDKIREELYGDACIQGDPAKVFRIMQKRVTEYLKKDFDVVYDATNVTRKNRRSIIEQVKHIVEPDGIECHIVWAPYNECVARDKLRKRSVGEEVIRKFIYRWQSPYYDEGINKIKLVFNCNVGWDRIRYTNAMLDGMNIPHNNPHHTLPIDEHCAAAENFCSNKWPKEPYLAIAAAYHDIGKPFTKGYKSDKETGKIDYSVAHYYQHDNVGGYLAYGCFADTEERRNDAVLISWLVCNHMQPYFQSNYYKSMNIYLKSFLDKLHEADVAAH